jgi:rhodanese-related sulfurtransferase
MPHGPRFQQLANEAKSKIREISIQEADQRRQKGALLIDVREADEFSTEHLPGALHLSKGVIEVRIEAQVPDPGREIICYCGGGNRSALVVESLQKMGYENAASMAGGFKAWKEADLPVVS